MIEPRLVFPFSGDYYMSEAYGENPSYYKLKWNLAGHEGINWDLPENTPVLAADAGNVSRIVSVSNLPPEQYPYGVYVFVAHAWGESVYAHLGSVSVNMNQAVSAGDQLGLSGRTGSTTKPTLHFGIRFTGYNPDDGFRGYANPHRFLPTKIVVAPTIPALHGADEHPKNPVLCRTDVAGIPLFSVAIYSEDTGYWVEVASGSILYPVGWIEIPGQPQPPPADQPATTTGVLS